MKSRNGAGKPRLVRISERSLEDITPSPENALLYSPVDPQDPDIVALARSIAEIGVREPLVVTAAKRISLPEAKAELQETRQDALESIPPRGLSR